MQSYVTNGKLDMARVKEKKVLGDMPTDKSVQEGIQAKAIAGKDATAEKAK